MMKSINMMMMMMMMMIIIIIIIIIIIHSCIHIRICLCSAPQPGPTFYEYIWPEQHSTTQSELHPCTIWSELQPPSGLNCIPLPLGQLLAQDSCMVVKSIAAKWVAWHVFGTMMVTTDHTLVNVRLQSPITQRPLVAARTKIKGAWRA